MNKVHLDKNFGDISQNEITSFEDSDPFIDDNYENQDPGSSNIKDEPSSSDPGDPNFASLKDEPGWIQQKEIKKEED